MEFLSQSKQNLNLNRKPSCNSLRSFLPKLLRLPVKEFDPVFTMGHPMKTQVGWMYSIIFWMTFVTSSTISVVISGDFNLPDILWDSTDSTSDVNELAFIETRWLHDYLLTQLNKKPTRGNNILDLLITSVLNRVNVTDILSPKDTGVFRDHSVCIFQFNAFIKAPLKTLRFVYDSAKGDFEGLRTALSAILKPLFDHSQ